MSSGFVVIIPARMAAVRLPGKPLIDIAGKPMIVRVAEQAQKSSAKRVVVATDHLDILEACRNAGLEAVMTRVDHRTGTDRLAEAVDLLALEDDTVVVNVQGDEPLISPTLINELARRLETTTAPVGTIACPIRESKDFLNPNIVKVVLDASDRALYFSRAPIPWPRDVFQSANNTLPADLAAWRHIGIYAYRAGFLKIYTSLKPVSLEQFEVLEQLRVLSHGYTITVLCTRTLPAAGVDIPEDVARVVNEFTNLS